MLIPNFLRIPVVLFSYLRTRWLLRFLNTKSRLQAWQRKQIEKHLRFLYLNSPYYADLIESDDLDSWRDLPQLTKQDLMENFSQLNTLGISRDEAFNVAIGAERSRDFSPMVKGVTVGLSSGTSGHRGIFMASKLEQWKYAGTILAKILPGFWRQKNRVAFFLRANNNLYTAVRGRTLQFEYFDLLKPVEEHVLRLTSIAPTILIAPPSLLRQLAEYKKRGELGIQPEKIVSVAEVLDPMDEAFISAVFAQKVHQVYQATEGFLAVTCSEGVLHLNEDILHVEKEWLDRSQRKFQPVITDFTRKTQPIVRYKLNDILTERATPCPCSSPFTALEFIEGRSDDLFQFPKDEGRPISSGADLVTVYPDFIRRAILLASDFITDYRVKQITPTSICVEFSHESTAQTPPRLEVEAAIRREFNDLSKKLRFVLDKIEFSEVSAARSVTEGRKLRRIVNEVKL